MLDRAARDADDVQIPEWAEDEARRIVAAADIKAKREGRTLWDALVKVLGAELAARGKPT